MESSSTPPPLSEAPLAPPDGTAPHALRGVFTTQHALFYVPTPLATAWQGQTGYIPWSDLAILKLLMPEETADLVVCGDGAAAAIIRRLAQRALALRGY